MMWGMSSPPTKPTTKLMPNLLAQSRLRRDDDGVKRGEHVNNLQLGARKALGTDEGAQPRDGTNYRAKRMARPGCLRRCNHRDHLQHVTRAKSKISEPR